MKLRMGLRWIVVWHYMGSTVFCAFALPLADFLAFRLLVFGGAHDGSIKQPSSLSSNNSFPVRFAFLSSLACCFLLHSACDGPVPVGGQTRTEPLSESCRFNTHHYTPRKMTQSLPLFGFISTIT